MAAPLAPIIALRESDGAVSAFFTAVEAVYHFSDTHQAADQLEEWRFFDGGGRELALEPGPDASLPGLRVVSDKDHGDIVRERVRSRSNHARQALERSRDAFDRVDESPLTLADDDVAFEIFAWRLANALRPELGPSDPVLKDGYVGPIHSAGWWHNTFGH